MEMGQLIMALDHHDEPGGSTSEAKELLSSDSMPRAWIRVVFYLVILLSSISYLKIHACQATLASYQANPAGMFWSEAAVQYRYAKMIASGQPIPAYDKQLQYPEGVRPHETLTLLMEYVTGSAFRILDRFFPKRVTLHVFLVLWACLFSSLSAVAVYALAWRVFNSHSSAVLASLLYGFCPATADRLVVSFNREDFALPILFGAFAFFVYSIHPSSTFRRRLIWGCCAAMLFAAGLAAWHFTRFFLLVFAVVAAAGYVVARRESLKTLGLSLAIVTTTIIIAGFTMPVLHTRQFVWSPAVLMCVATTASISIVWHCRRGAFAEDALWKRLAVWLLIAASLSLGSITVAPRDDAYGHVWALLIEKVSRFGVKPQDPALLPFDARVLWVEAFNSPSLAYLLGTCGAILPLFAVSSYRLARRRERGAEDALSLLMLLGMTCSFAALFMLIVRLSVFAIFFLSVSSGAAICGLANRKTTVLTFVLTIALAALFAYDFPLGHTSYVRGLLGSREPPMLVKWPADDELLVNWVKENTPKDAVFLSRFATAPVILAYAERAIVVQPKFESAGIRAKVRESLEAVYGSEAGLVDFCQANGATYYLFDLELCLASDVDSARYVANALRLSTATPAFQMQFAPERLERFQLVYQNSFYRVFKLVDQTSAELPRNSGYYPCYDLKQFGGQTGRSPYFEDGFTEDVLKDQRETVRLFRQGRAAYEQRQFSAALRYFDEVIRRHPALYGVHTYRGLCLAMMGQLNEALSEAQREVVLHPGSANAHFRFGLLRASTNDFEGALQSWNRCRELDPNYPGLEDVISGVQQLRSENSGAGRANRGID